MADSAIKVENLGKKYIINHQKQERYTALRDVIAKTTKSIGKKILNPFQETPNPLMCPKHSWSGSSKRKREQGRVSENTSHRHKTWHRAMRKKLRSGTMLLITTMGERRNHNL